MAKYRNVERKSAKVITLKCNLCVCVAVFVDFVSLTPCRYFQDFLMKGKQVGGSAAKKMNQAWIHGKKWAKKGQRIARHAKNKVFAFTGNKFLELSGTVTHPRMKLLFRNLALRCNRGVTIAEGGNTSQEVVVESSTRPSRKRTTNQVRSTRDIH